MPTFRRAALVALALTALVACGDGGTRPAGQPTTAASLEVPPLHPSVDGYPETVVEITTDGSTHRLAVKVASTPAERAHGLMEVPELPEGTGMLFTFDGDRDGGFWMKDTLVALDIAFVDADGTIVAILAMDPCTVADCPSYAPGTPYRSALEVPQGWFARTGITVGDHLTTYG